MTADHHARGGAALGVLNRMDAWEANLVLNLRLWCEGPQGQAQVWNEYRKSLSGGAAHNACRNFEGLLNILTDNAYRPLVRHDVGCSCIGADECIFLQLVKTASEGHLNDAALIATLIAGPAHAEHIALLAGEVGACAREIHPDHPDLPTSAGSNVVRLH